MPYLFSSGHIIDLVLALVVVEGALLTGFHRLTGRGVPPRDFALNLVSGGFLMFAVREALVQAAWWAISVCLLAALVAHVADVVRRWRW